MINSSPTQNVLTVFYVDSVNCVIFYFKHNFESNSQIEQFHVMPLTSLITSQNMII